MQRGAARGQFPRGRATGAMRVAFLAALLAAPSALLLFFVGLLGATSGAGRKPSASTIVQALSPSGLRISVPDAPGVEVVIINANINLPIAQRETGQVSGSILESRNGFWTLEVDDVTLKPGDVVFYWVYIENRGNGERTTGHQPIHELSDPKCRPSPTTVNGRTTCAGQLLLEENFNTINTSLWRHTIQFSDFPDQDFSTYTDSPENSFVKDGILHLRATVLREEELLIPTKLERCTWENAGAQYCERHPVGWDILPPTRSAMLTTKGTFTFKYGRIEIRAKTAAGDWLMSKLVLDPKDTTYGSVPFESGRMEMLRSRGNPDVLEPSGWQLGAPLNDPQADIKTCGRTLWLFKNCPLKFGKLYSDQMRVFSLIWTPVSITMTIDGECAHVIRPPEGGFIRHHLFKDNCDNSPLERGSIMAPFDREFHIYIGLLVAGFNNYLNEVVSKGQNKPWQDGDPKSWLKFWQKRNIWQPSWTSDMEVDYVKVWAL